MIELGRDREAAELAVRDAGGSSPHEEDVVPDPSEQPEVVDAAGGDAPSGGTP
jgi:hypothetical protein